MRLQKQLVIIASGCVFARAARAAVIGLDNVHGFDSNAFLATGSDFDTLRSVFTGLGHTIVPLNGFGASNLAGLDAAFVVIPYTQNVHTSYSAGEIAALQALAGNRAAFVSDTDPFCDSDAGSDRPITFGDNRRLLENIVSFLVAGRGVAFLADDGTGFNVTNFNSLVAPYGVAFATNPTDGDGRTVTGFVPHAMTAGLNQIGVDFQLPMTISGPAIDLTIGGGQDNVIAAIPEPGSTLFISLGLVALWASRRRTRRRFADAATVAGK